jgi:hypothetical protein
MDDPKNLINVSGSFFRNRFLSMNQNTARSVQTHFTTSTDITVMKKILQDVMYVF